MKKIILLALLCIGSVFAFHAPAAEAEADEVSIPLLKRWASEKYGCKVDKDGDLMLNSDNGKFFVSVIGKAKLIRIFSLFAAEEGRSRSEMRSLANKFNDSKRFLRVAVDESDGSVTCDYYIVYDGGLNSANFLEALDWFVNLEKAWARYVVNGGDDE